MIIVSAVANDVKDEGETERQAKIRLYTYDPPRLGKERNVSILINSMN